VARAKTGSFGRRALTILASAVLAVAVMSATSRALDLGPPDTKALVVKFGGQSAVKILFTPSEGVTYGVYKHSFGDERTFRLIGSPGTYSGGTVSSSDPNWGTVTPSAIDGQYVTYTDTDVADYAEYYYFVWASTDPDWPTDEVTGRVYPPLERYRVARAFPPTQTRHGEFSEFTGACTACHGLHSAMSTDKLLKARTVTDLCASCHDGSGSKYDLVMGRVRVGPDWTNAVDNPGGPFGTVLKDFPGAPQPTSAHNVWRDGKTADGSPTATAAQLWQAPGSTYLSSPGETVGYWTRPLVCTGCHEPHNRFQNFRLLRGDFGSGEYRLPDNQGGVRQNVVVRGVSEINLGVVGGVYQMASRYLGGSSQTGAAITDFCTGCHRFFAGPFNELNPAIVPGYDPFSPPGVDDYVYDNPGTHGWKRHMMAMPASNALLWSGARIIDPGETGTTGYQGRVVDWDGTNLRRSYVPLEGMREEDGDKTNGNQYAENKVVCLTCHNSHSSAVAAGGRGPGGEALQIEVAYRNDKLNFTETMPPGDGYEEDVSKGYKKGRSPVSGYLMNRGSLTDSSQYFLLFGSSSVLSRFEPFASECWRCHSTE